MNKNVPNILTMSRIACTPLVVLFFLLPIPYGIGKYIAFFIYVAACVTDLLDGKIARKYNLVSDFGKFMDQIADKFITTTSMILVLLLGTVDGWIPMWASTIMLLVVVLRDILIGGVRMVAANKNIVIAADIYGKIKSLFLDSANGVLLFYIALAVCVDNWFTNELKYLGLSLMIVGVVLAVISCVNYIRGAIDGLKAVKENELNDENQEVVENVENSENEEISETEDADAKQVEESKEETLEESAETSVEENTETDGNSMEEENQEEQIEETVESEETTETEEVSEIEDANAKQVEASKEEISEESAETSVEENAETDESSTEENQETVEDTENSENEKIAEIEKTKKDNSSSENVDAE